MKLLSIGIDGEYANAVVCLTNYYSHRINSLTLYIKIKVEKKEQVYKTCALKYQRKGIVDQIGTHRFVAILNHVNSHLASHAYE